MHLKILCFFLWIATVVVAHPTVYFVRHGEKPRNGGDGLSILGLRRAECLRHVFGAGSDYNIGYIIAQRPKKNGKRARPYDTMKPLSRDLGLTVDTSCQRNDYKCVKRLVKSYRGEGNILVCWEHSRMSHIIKALGNRHAPSYPKSRYDIIWTDPSPYHEITREDSERCPGLDQPLNRAEI